MTPQADDAEKEVVQTSAQPPDPDDDDDLAWPSPSAIEAARADIRAKWSPEKERARRTFYEETPGVPAGAKWYYDRPDIPEYPETDFR